MALAKEIKKNSSYTTVKFIIEEHEAPSSSSILLLGDFNDWQTNSSASQMKKEGNTFVKNVKLENGKRYEFRYLSENKGWFNDSAADGYTSSPFEGIENSVVDLSTVPVKKKAVKKVKKDDLKKIEGVGTKLSSILIENGIETFKKLSNTSVSVLETIIKEAGPRYRMHKPGSWPEQAKLAQDGKWEELKQLQDILDGGK
ncbi:hypothetical protein CLV91_1723 [Maribacter vaceletii]|uniref:Uncharacterized protein n=1 Tax=Maribacter vaceletii TaxID=1206816 RepID=A0A495E8V6_9FLAO|nr:hypothetical protein [Maribacter vaceletii]RKR13009.1 hypothetical protein CLV91_1723 [Maribacter vaceletii]